MSLSALTLNATAEVLIWGDDGDVPIAGAGETRHTNIVLASASVVNDPVNTPRYTTVSAGDGGSFVALTAAQRIVRNAANVSSSQLSGLVFGLTISSDGVTPDEIVDIAPGVCVDSSNTEALLLEAEASPDITVSGIGGLFTGTVAANTWYAIFVIRRSDTGAISTGFDTSVIAANIPAPYDQFRRIGWVRTDATSDILAFEQLVQGADRWTYWRNDVEIQTNGTSAAFAATTVSAATRVPSTAVKQQLSVTSTKVGNGSSGSRGEVVPDGWDETGTGLFWGVKSGFTEEDDTTAVSTLDMPVGPSQLVRYRAFDAQVDVRVNGYQDAL